MQQIDSAGLSESKRYLTVLLSVNFFTYPTYFEAARKAEC